MPAGASGSFFNGDLDKQPFDFRSVGLHRTAGHILGVDPSEIIPDLRQHTPRRIAEPYVCIATQSTSQAKFWNNGTGWHEVIDYLQAQGYRVLCIDKERVVGRGYVWNKIPHGAEDFTGNLPLADRVALLEHADFFYRPRQRPLLACLGLPYPGGADQRFQPAKQRVLYPLARHQHPCLQRLLG